MLGRRDPPPKADVAVGGYVRRERAQGEDTKGRREQPFDEGLLLAARSRLESGSVREY